MASGFAKALDGLPRVVKFLPATARKVKFSASPPPFAAPV